MMFGGGLYCGKFFQFFSVFFLGIFCVIHNFCFVQYVPIFEFIFELKKMLFMFFHFYFFLFCLNSSFQMQGFPNN